jgi:hypothetical protein
MLANLEAWLDKAEAHAHAILRHNGVELGKADYLGALTLHGA